uniref:Uncharacterized protein n=1 Tax=Anguilla anguilla TaxID=7936 RepID=A0A0E9UQQ7_ANGAN
MQILASILKYGTVKVVEKN